jgi:hypothetical protein
VIRLQRVRTPSAIVPGFRGQKRVDRALALLQMPPPRKFTSKTSYWGSTKKQLELESSGKCAYCEAPTDLVAHGDVEHYRPKSVYWWLAYCYDNYLYSCQICNQSYKGDNFPVHGARMTPDPPVPEPLPAGLSPAQLRQMASRLAPDPLNDAEGRPIASFTAAAAAERAWLPDPYVVNPEPFFAWEADEVLKEVEVKPRNQKPATLRTFRAAVEVVGLNREELRKWRWKLTYRPLLLCRRGLGVPGADTAELKQILKEMMEPGEPFAAMARYFVRDVWQIEVGP